MEVAHQSTLVIDQHPLEPVLLGIVEKTNSSKDVSVCFGDREVGLLQYFAL